MLYENLSILLNNKSTKVNKVSKISIGISFLIINALITKLIIPNLNSLMYKEYFSCAFYIINEIGCIFFILWAFTKHIKLKHVFVLILVTFTIHAFPDYTIDTKYYKIRSVEFVTCCIAYLVFAIFFKRHNNNKQESDNLLT